MVQPIKDGDNRRTVVVRLRVTMAERQLLEEKAAEAGLTLSDWIRSKAIDSKPLLRKLRPEKEVLLRLLAEQGKVGSNLNQISRQLNRKQETNEFAMPLEIIMLTIKAVKGVSDQLRETLDHGSHPGTDKG